LPIEAQQQAADLTYRQAGVDIEAGEEAVRLIKADAESTYIPGVLGSIGGFAGMFQLPSGLQDPVRVTSRRGELEGYARLTDDVQPGAVFVPFVKLAESAANFLTNSAHDPTSKIPEYKVCAVRIEPVPAGVDARSAAIPAPRP
jgi:hypothetical protein